MSDFAVWLRQARKGAGLSQDQLAALAQEQFPGSGIYQGRLTDWENAKSLPSLRQLAVVALSLALPEEDWLEGRSHWERAQLSDLPTPGHVPPSGELENGSTVP